MRPRCGDFVDDDDEDDEDEEEHTVSSFRW